MAVRKPNFRELPGPHPQAVLFRHPKSKPWKGKLNREQYRQLKECLAAGIPVKINSTPKSMNKAWQDTPLFGTQQEQTRLF
jgi:hypothetical protein